MVRFRNRNKSGKLYWVESTMVPFMDEQGRPSRYVSIISDITARKDIDARTRGTARFL